MWDKYYSVNRVEDALQLLDQYRSHARIIAGGTDLLLEIAHGKHPDVQILIDITRIPELAEIQLQDDVISLGPLVNHNHAAGSQIIRQHALPLAQACWEVGAPQIRNRGTIAGNIITASAANDTIPALIALKAQVTLSSVEGQRVIPIEQFFTGLRRTVLQPQEMVTAISFPILGERGRGTFLKLGLRRAQAISVVNVAVVVQFAPDQTVDQAVITLGSVAPTVIRTPVAEAFLKGKVLEEAVIGEAAHLAATTPTPITDIRSTAEYRTEMVRVLTGRALRAIAENRANTLPEAPAMLWGESQAKPRQTAAAFIHEADTVIECTINGNPVSVANGQQKTLLHWLRDDVGLPGTKEGCSEGECGACTVFLDGAAVMACMVPAARAQGADIVTVEGLRQQDRLHVLQESFIEHGAVQCGYCTPGFVMSGAKLLEEHPHPTVEQIQQSVSGNLCRCTGYFKIVQAFIDASEKQS